MIRFFYYIFFNFLVGCQTMKKDFQFKSRGADEFLVEKKNPLVQPPSMENFRLIRVNEKKMMLRKMK